MVTLQKAFNKDGYVVLKNFFTNTPVFIDCQQNILSILSHRLKIKKNAQSRISKRRRYLDKQLVKSYKENTAHVSFAYDVLSNSPEVYNLLCDKKLLTVINQLLLKSSGSSNAIVNNVNCRIDLPGKSWSENLPWHQDWPYNNPLYIVNNSLVAWVSIFGADDELGSIRLLKKTHQLGELQHEKVRMPGQSKRKDPFCYKVSDKVIKKHRKSTIITQCEPGDVLLFDINLIHASGINKTKNRIRWSAQARYHNAFYKEFMPQYSV